VTLPRLVIAGTHSGVGKTTATLALLAALKARGHVIQAFKVGPDFIDPGHHTAVTGRPSRNLDGWMLDRATNCETFARAAADAELSIIEGMMGLYDGSSPTNEVGSTAELAKQLDVPVLLVIDGSAMARSVAAMVSGYARFDPKVRIVGVLFNRVGSEGHYHLLKLAVEQATNVPVVGYLRPDPAVTVTERYLGLVTAVEEDADTRYSLLAKAAEETVDLERIVELAHACRALTVGERPSVPGQPSCGIRIGVAQDRAFCFYYPDNLDLLRAAGAELVPFSPLEDQVLPAVELLYLGGGYPELYAKRLTSNYRMRAAIRSFAEQGGVVYAECGGMMYLTSAIHDCDGTAHEMVGLFPAEILMQKSGLTIGYRTVEFSQSSLLGLSGVVRGHEFHSSMLIRQGPVQYACTLRDAQGVVMGDDGLFVHNTLALYTHLHFASRPQVAHALVAAAAGTRAPSGIQG
jgi:cobyrinic acid a,c-diamide synthase